MVVEEAVMVRKNEEARWSIRPRRVVVPYILVCLLNWVVVVVEVV